MSWLFWLFILVLLAAAAGSAFMAYRTYIVGDATPNLKGWLFRPRPEPRLAVIEQAAVDSRRRLLLVRRDNVEHLIMTGGPVDVVIETGISEGGVHAESPAARSEPVGRAEPSPPVFARQPRAFGQAVNE